MSILVKHGDPGILVGLADAAGQLAGAGRVRDQVFQANVGDQSQRRAASTQFQNASGLEAQRQAGQIAAQNNAAAIREREIASVRSLTERRSRDEEADPYTGGMVRSPRGRSVRSSIPADAGYLDDMALKAATLAERQRQALADEEQARAELAQREADSQRRGYQADLRIGQGQQRVEQGQARVEQGQQRVEQGAARVQQGDRRLTETERRNLSTEDLRRQQIARKVYDGTDTFDRGSEALASGADTKMLRQMLGPVFNPGGPTDADGLPATSPDGTMAKWTKADQTQAMRADAAIRAVGRMRDKSGRYILSVPEMQARLEEIATDPDISGRYMATLEDNQRVLVRDVVDVYQQIGESLASADAATAAELLARGAERANMTPEDFTDSVEFLIERGILQRPGEVPMGAGPGPEQQQQQAAEVASATQPQQIEFDPETGEVYIKGSEGDPRRPRRNDSE